MIGQIITIVTNPAGTPVDGQPGTFDYPILTSVTLMCMAIAADGSPVIVTSYRWTASECYTRAGGVENPCFYDNNPTGQNITGNDLLAPDAGTVTCTATIDGMDYTSDPLTLRISGESEKAIVHCLLLLGTYIHTLISKCLLNFFVCISTIEHTTMMISYTYHIIYTN